MKVVDCMSKDPVIVKPEESIGKAVRVFYNLGISAVLVAKNRRLCGILTEENILQNLFPSLQEFMESFSHASDPKVYEDNLRAILRKPISQYMTKRVKHIAPGASIMRAQSHMLVHNFSHLPVVNEEGHIVGIVAQGDIFNALVGMEVPQDDEEEYHNWISYHFDLIQSQWNRYEQEAEDIVKRCSLKSKARFLDVGCGTGGHDVALCKKGYSVVGLETSTRMHKACMNKWAMLNEKKQTHLFFNKGHDYASMIHIQKELFDTVLFLGNSLAHRPETYKRMLQYAISKLVSGGYVIIQLSNIDRIFAQNRLRSFSIRPSRFSQKQEYAFVEFYDPPRERKNILTLNMAILKFANKRWARSTINSTPIVHIAKQNIGALLKSANMQNIVMYGSRFGEALFDHRFDIQKHDWLTVIAQKG